MTKEIIVSALIAIFIIVAFIAIIYSDRFKECQEGMPETNKKIIIAFFILSIILTFLLGFRCGYQYGREKTINHYKELTSERSD